MAFFTASIVGNPAFQLLASISDHRIAPLEESPVFQGASDHVLVERLQFLVHFLKPAASGDLQTAFVPVTTATFLEMLSLIEIVYGTVFVQSTATVR